MERYIKDGKVGVLISYGYGAGWSTWNSKEWAYDKRIIEKFLELCGQYKDIDNMSYDELEKLEKDMEVFMKGIGYKGYCGGIRGLTLEMIPIGTPIKINEYDGAESIEYGYSNFDVL